MDMETYVCVTGKRHARVNDTRIAPSPDVHPHAASAY